MLYVFLLSVVFALCAFQFAKLRKKREIYTESPETLVPTATISPPKDQWPSLDPEKLSLYSARQKRNEATRLFNKASTYSGEDGEGRQGWLHLLAAYSYDKQNLNILSNLIGNYEALNYGVLGYSTLLESKIAAADMDRLMPTERQQQLAADLQLAADSLDGIEELEPDCTTIMFATAVSRWNMTERLPPSMNKAVYDKSMAEYERLKASRPDLSPTDLNHAFFRVQMAELDTSSSYWGPFKDIEGFPELVASMRKSVLTFLQRYHGWDAEAAKRKASHPLVVWVSVHTADSVHQPYVTEDALVGGVYYVSVPKGSGKLHMYDPRGKHPLLGLEDPTSAPSPPFHRIASLAPAESLLVLFPGWLVHSVGKASAKSFGGGAEAKYRVSLSLNLKGEWTDTSSASFGCPTYPTSPGHAP
eukprot:gene29875-36071_t